MSQEKVVTFSELKGQFTKDFATIGKMVRLTFIKDAFLEFTVGNCVAKTETAEGMKNASLEAGREPVWKEDVVLTYFD